LDRSAAPRPSRPASQIAEQLLAHRDTYDLSYFAAVGISPIGFAPQHWSGEDRARWPPISRLERDDELRVPIENRAA
jgi:hypothetical protein